MLIFLITAPLLSALTTSFFGRHFGRIGCSLTAIALTGTATAIALKFFLTHLYFYNSDITYISLNTWFATTNTFVIFSFYIDNLTQVMYMVILSISFIVHWYSYDYLYTDPHLTRFMAFLSYFTFFMLILVSAGDLITLFIGWEGVGLFSYLLINFWYTRLQANKSALKAVFINKIGDVGILLAITFTHRLYGTSNFCVIHALTPFITQYTLHIFSYSATVLDLIAIFLVIGAVGKSAQLGLHVWLPDAMEGPTPVSALLHAATMVTAGVFLFLRMAIVLDYKTQFAAFILVIGSLTTFFAATTGLLQNDIKRIIAFSTCSQLGYMFSACGLAQYSLSLFHLFNHAFFKALLFLAAGSVIHCMNNEQDIRRMGYLYKFLPVSFSFFTIASFSLMGLPYLSGYFSKDIIIEQALLLPSRWIFFLLIFGAFITASYSIRLLFYVFLSQPNFRRSTTNFHDASLYVQIPLIILAILSITSGFYFNESFVGFGYNNLSNVFPSQALIQSIEVEYIPIYIKILPFIGSLAAMQLTLQLLQQKILGLVWNVPFSTSLSWLLAFYHFLNHKWFFDKLYNTIAFFLVHRSYQTFFVFLEKGIFEAFGPTGIYAFIVTTSQKVIILQKGYIATYLQYLISAFLVILCILPILFSVT
jgi:proton-translocating NADH-quinone oxidoreductase chain L